MRHNRRRKRVSEYKIDADCEHNVHELEIQKI